MTLRGAGLKSLVSAQPIASEEDGLQSDELMLHRLPSSIEKRIQLCAVNNNRPF